MLFEHSVETWVVFCRTSSLDTPPRRPLIELASIFKGVVSIFVVLCSTSSVVLIRYHYIWKKSVTALAVYRRNDC